LRSFGTCEEISYYDVQNFPTTSINKYVFTNKFKNNAYWSHKYLLLSLKPLCSRHNSIDAAYIDDQYQNYSIVIMRLMAQSAGDYFINTTALKDIVEFDLISSNRHKIVDVEKDEKDKKEVDNKFINKLYPDVKIWSTAITNMVREQNIRGKIIVGERNGLALMQDYNYIESTIGIDSKKLTFSYSRGLMINDYYWGTASFSYVADPFQGDEKSHFFSIRYQLIF
jgi:hypothetical protein